MSGRGAGWAAAVGGHGPACYSLVLPGISVPG